MGFAGTLRPAGNSFYNQYRKIQSKGEGGIIHGPEKWRLNAQKYLLGEVGQDANSVPPTQLNPHGQSCVKVH